MLSSLFESLCRWMSCAVLTFCIVCGCVVILCPCDKRYIYAAPNGVRYKANGTKLPKDGIREKF